VDSTELTFDILINVLGCCVPSIVFSDAETTKIHDSLPMVLFRFQHAMTLLTEGLKEQQVAQGWLGWFGYFLSWALFNEGMSQENTPTDARLA
jgi:hypothetical protein